MTAISAAAMLPCNTWTHFTIGAQITSAIHITVVSVTGKLPYKSWAHSTIRAHVTCVIHVIEHSLLSGQWTSTWMIQGHREPPFKCETCYRRFYTQKSADQHMDAVNHYKGHCCRPCSKILQTENALKMVCYSYAPYR